MARRQKHEEHENHERWLVSYADFITLLFAFFTVLYATSQHDIAKQIEVEKAITKAFDPLVEFGGLIGRYIDVNTDVSLLPPPIPLVPQEGHGQEEVKQAVQNILEKEMGEETYRELIEIKTDKEGVRVSVKASGFFDPGSALIREDSLRSLEKIGDVLKATNRNLRVEGHTDDQPIHTEKFPSNWELSATRATTVVRYLIARHHIHPSRLAAVAYADQRPKVSNDSDKNRAQNRRIDVLILMPDIVQVTH